MPEPTPPSLRDRKRRQTRSRIESAALFLVLRDGLASTTVEAISARADISPRTFFNYFDTKDAALLGVATADVEEPIEPSPGGELIEEVVRMLMRTMGMTPDTGAGSYADRLEVIRRHPEVLAGQVSQLNTRAARLNAAIETLMAQDPRFPEAEGRSLEAEVLLSLCGGAIRAAARSWSSGQAAARPRPVAPPTGRAIEQRAIALIEKVIGTLS